ncbi:MAG: hypothetical protein ABI337_00785 [Nitrososphaera sp.]|jgi:hypothetical protein
MAKTHRFYDYNVDIERLATRIETYLTENNFEVAFSKDQTQPTSWCFIQARKLGALRTAAGARRSTDISIRGVPNNFEVAVGTGEWGKNLIMSAPLFVVPVIGIAATLTKIYTAKKFENNLWKYIKEQANFLRESALAGKKQTKTMDQREFDCDYVEGYPGWHTQVRGGRLILQRQKSGDDKIIFESQNSKKIIIAAANIEKAAIISKKKGFNEHDLMIEIRCKDEKGNTIHPVFNLADDIIAGVLAGINELVAEDRYLRDLYK